MTHPPLLSKPKPNEKLQLYLSVLETAVSAMLVREDDGKQLSVYYVSKSLLDAEMGYAYLEKLVLPLVMSFMKLRPYFESHPIIVRTNYPI